jgi:hypothetical protein
MGVRHVEHGEHHHAPLEMGGGGGYSRPLESLQERIVSVDTVMWKFHPVWAPVWRGSVDAAAIAPEWDSFSKAICSWPGDSDGEKDMRPVFSSV